MGSDPESLTATLGNDSGAKENVNQQQRRELPLPLFINSSEMFIFSLWGLTPECFLSGILSCSPAFAYLPIPSLITHL